MGIKLTKEDVREMCSEEARAWELENVRADIDRTARVVQALAIAFSAYPDSRKHSDSATAIALEGDEQDKRLLDLLARERALMSPAKDEEKPARDEQVDVDAVAMALAIEMLRLEGEVKGKTYGADYEENLAKSDYWQSMAKAAITAAGKQPARDVGELLTTIETLAEHLDTARKIIMSDADGDEDDDEMEGEVTSEARALVAKWREKGG